MGTSLNTSHIDYKRMGTSLYVYAPLITKGNWGKISFASFLTSHFCLGEEL